MDPADVIGLYSTAQWQPNLDETTRVAHLTRQGAGRGAAGLNSKLNPTLGQAQSWPGPSATSLGLGALEFGT